MGYALISKKEFDALSPEQKEIHLCQKRIFDQQYNEAYFGGNSEESKRAASDNRAILRGVSSRFRHLDEHERESCELQALCRALQNHEEGHGQKFTTSLYRFAVWECCRELRRKRRKSESRLSLKDLKEISRYVVDEHDSWSEPTDKKQQEIFAVLEHVDKLPYSWQKHVLEQYYVMGLTHEQIGFRNGGYSKETARLKVEQAMSELRYLCQESIDLEIPDVRNACVC